MVDELLELIALQEKEIEKLERTIARVKQYLEIYEEYIERGTE